jgi:hypothetical protein
VQLENLTVSNYLAGFRVLLLSYDGQKTLSPAVHSPLAAWVRQGGMLIVCDRDADPYNRVREWWNSEGRALATPREHLFAELGLRPDIEAGKLHRVRKGGVLWLRERPADLSTSAKGAARIVQATREAAQAGHLKWRETNYLLLQRGPYVIAAGLDESIGGAPRKVTGRFVNLFDPELRVRNEVTLTPGSRWFLLDLDAARRRAPHVLLSAGKALPVETTRDRLKLAVEGVGDTPSILLLESPKPPRTRTLDGKPLESFDYSAREKLLWIRFENEARPRELAVQFAS